MSLTTAGELLNIPASVSFSIAWNLCYLLTLISILKKKDSECLEEKVKFIFLFKINIQPYSPENTFVLICNLDFRLYSINSFFFLFLC